MSPKKLILASVLICSVSAVQAKQTPEQIMNQNKINFANSLGSIPSESESSNSMPFMGGNNSMPFMGGNNSSMPFMGGNNSSMPFMGGNNSSMPFMGGNNSSNNMKMPWNSKGNRMKMPWK